MNRRRHAQHPVALVVKSRSSDSTLILRTTFMFCLTAYQRKMQDVFENSAISAFNRNDRTIPNTEIRFFFPLEATDLRFSS